MKYKFLLFTFVLLNTANLYSNERNIVKTNSGTTYGYVKNGVINWDDIPYAQPPVNDLRWKAPRKIELNSKIVAPKEDNFVYSNQVEWEVQRAMVFFWNRRLLISRC